MLTKKEILDRLEKDGVEMGKNPERNFIFLQQSRRCRRADDLEIGACLGAEIEDDLTAAKAVHQVVGSDAHLGHAGRDGDAALAASKGLLVDVGMEQQPSKGTAGIGLEHRAVRQDGVPAIGIVLPPRVGMAHGDVQGPRAIVGLHGFDIGHVGVAVAVAF